MAVLYMYCTNRSPITNLGKTLGISLIPKGHMAGGEAILTPIFIKSNINIYILAFVYRHS